MDDADLHVVRCSPPPASGPLLPPLSSLLIAPLFSLFSFLLLSSVLSLLVCFDGCVRLNRVSLSCNIQPHRSSALTPTSVWIQAIKPLGLKPMKLKRLEKAFAALHGQVRLAYGLPSALMV